MFLESINNSRRLRIFKAACDSQIALQIMFANKILCNSQFSSTVHIFYALYSQLCLHTICYWQTKLYRFHGIANSLKKNIAYELCKKCVLCIIFTIIFAHYLLLVNEALQILQNNQFSWKKTVHMNCAKTCFMHYIHDYICTLFVTGKQSSKNSRE